MKYKAWRKKLINAKRFLLAQNIAFYALIAISFAIGVMSYKLNVLNQSSDKITPTITPVYIASTETPTPTLTPTSVPASEITTIQQTTYDDWGKTVKLDDKTSASRFAPDDHMSTVEELNQAMNQYRQAHNLPTLNPHPVLCNMAQTRANQLQALGALDHHAGASALAHSQQTFDTIDEVLFGGVQPVSGVHIVEWGWDQSLTGHHEAISDSRWHDGCGGIAGLFAVFEFGAK